MYKIMLRIIKKMFIVLLASTVNKSIQNMCP